MTLWSWSTRRSGCAASMPTSASATTVVGSLISFFIAVAPVRSCWSRDRLGLADDLLGVDLDGLVDPGPGDGDVSDACCDASEHLGDDVDRQLRPVHGATEHLQREHGPDNPGRVDGCGR